MRLLKMVTSFYENHCFTKTEKLFFRNHDDNFYPKTEFHLAKFPLFSDVTQYLSCHISHSSFDFSNQENENHESYRSCIGIIWKQNIFECWACHPANNLARSPPQQFVGGVTCSTLLGGIHAQQWNQCWAGPPSTIWACHLPNTIVGHVTCSTMWSMSHAQQFVGGVTFPTMKSVLGRYPPQQSEHVTPPTNCWGGDMPRLLVQGGGQHWSNEELAVRCTNTSSAWENVYQNKLI